MSGLILFVPWSADEIARLEPRIIRALQAFSEIPQAVPPFASVSADWYSDVLLALYANGGHGGRQVVTRILGQLVSNEEPTCSSVVEGLKRRLSAAFEHGLALALGDGSDWRCPQIVVPTELASAWPTGPFASVSRPACGGLDELQPQRRVLATLEEYFGHPHAISDHDPWDVRRLHHCAGARLFEAILPKPPECEGVRLSDLNAALHAALQRGWNRGEKFYFIPSPSWKATGVSEEQWRHSGAWLKGPAESNSRPGWLDAGDRCWQWDRSECHWDVQLPDGAHVRVNSCGDEL